MSDLTFGLFVRGQYHAGDDMRKRFEEVKAQVRLADQLGFSDLLTGMHYAAAPLQQYQLIPLLARLLAETERMRIITGIILLSLHKPLDIAEQLATLDVMSGGRLVFGAGLGYRDVEFKAFGTTARERVQRLEENLEAIKRLWTEDNVSMKGSHFAGSGHRVAEADTETSPTDLARRQCRCGGAPRRAIGRHLVHQPAPADGHDRAPTVALQTGPGRTGQADA
jgi:alkanesulfonate monooxygenase SsuD/methylene tetrahydromethanopterin reductase-like flavin-dependent oxidoreductase (luciferase family)